jgi:hypothetical protein
VWLYVLVSPVSCYRVLKHVHSRGGCSCRIPAQRVHVVEYLACIVSASNRLSKCPDPSRCSVHLDS